MFGHAWVNFKLEVELVDLYGGHAALGFSPSEVTRPDAGVEGRRKGTQGAIEYSAGVCVAYTFLHKVL